MASTSTGIPHDRGDTCQGPDGCRYDDSLTSLTIQLVVKGIVPKSFMKAANTDVYIKSDTVSMSCTVEIVKIDKKVKPAQRTVVDTRFFRVKKFPSEIDDVTFALKKNCCVLTIRKKTPASWENDISQLGF